MKHLHTLIHWYKEARQIPRIAMALVVMVGIFGSVIFDAWYQHAKEPLKYVAETAHAEEAKVPVQIRIDYSKMSSERIEAIIRESLPPIFVEIAKCEGGLRPHATGPTNDHGPLQIHLPTHGARIKKLGLDVVNNPYDNIKFAKILYEESGLQPWFASRKCWSRFLP